jgi:hypothetical protein
MYVAPVLVCLMVASLAGQARAYEIYRTEKTGEPLRWFVRDTLEMAVAVTPPEETDIANIGPLLQQAFASWVGVPCGTPPVVTVTGTSKALRATTPKSLRAEPDNILVFIRSSSEWTRFRNSPTWIAITKIAHNPKTGEIVDADIEINDGGFKFSYSGTPNPSEVDFLSMLTHEVGHFYGLDHSANDNATMYSTYASSPERAVAARTLTEDDIGGICALYNDVPVHVPYEADTLCTLGAMPCLAGLLVLLRRRTIRR